MRLNRACRVIRWFSNLIQLGNQGLTGSRSILLFLPRLLLQIPTRIQQSLDMVRPSLDMVGENWLLSIITLRHFSFFYNVTQPQVPIDIQPDLDIHQLSLDMVVQSTLDLIAQNQEVSDPLFLVPWVSNRLLFLK